MTAKHTYPKLQPEAKTPRRATDDERAKEMPGAVSHCDLEGKTVSTEHSAKPPVRSLGNGWGTRRMRTEDKKQAPALTGP